MSQYFHPKLRFLEALTSVPSVSTSVVILKLMRSTSHTDITKKFRLTISHFLYAIPCCSAIQQPRQVNYFSPVFYLLTSQELQSLQLSSLRSTHCLGISTVPVLFYFFIIIIIIKLSASIDFQNLNFFSALHHKRPPKIQEGENTSFFIMNNNNKRAWEIPTQGTGKWTK